MTPDDDVSALLRAVLDRAQTNAGQAEIYATLWAQIGRSVQGGKRFRARIVLATHDHLGGRRSEAAVTVAAAMEMLHTAFLIHDDLIDADTVRRGEPNLAATMLALAQDAGVEDGRARRWALACAVLAGDLALAQAHELVAQVDVPRPVADRLRSLLSETVFVSAAGELADSCFGLGLHQPTMAESLAVADAKTAMYSFQAPLRAGAVLADAPDALVAELDTVGRHLGRAFQLVDDLEGVFTPEAVSGKSDLSDLREGKRTPLLLHAQGLPVWAEIAGDVGRPDLAPADAARVRRALARSEAPGRTDAQVRHEVAQVHARVAGPVVPEAIAPFLTDLAGDVLAALEACTTHVEAAR
ncbi:polyprenyl synthetase family protein [Georgenia faecalis]|uniref:polyprenyl synthetase family protein n=1 Tax=Georgenia faecalis TaxID=2483799 RepID=UPI0013DDFD1C|nr:polyprenyl synthetase family protein [Georgenia faecalis]